ncbi:hypothetical protein LSH36_1379g00031, partial [Paralvinella palmiformis]
RLNVAVIPGDAFLDTVKGSAPEDPPKNGQAHLQHSFRRDIRYPDIIGYPVQGGNTPTCPNRIRAKALKARCENSPIRNYKYGDGPREHLRNVVLDHDRKLFYCLIGKAGSKSWLKYLVNTKHSNQKGHLRHNNFLQTVGLEMYRNMPLDLVNEEYKDYFKFLVVRHPLQRTVSAYYETVIFHKKYKNEREKLLNFTEFVGRVTSDMLDLNPHWRRYINRCLLCKVDYEYIVKTETMDEDIKGFNRAISVNDEEMTVKLSHQNPFTDNDEEDTTQYNHHYKYDKMLYELQRKDPDLMKKLLNVYGEDMHLFGYKWDWWRGRSTCGMEYDDRECC